MVTENISIEVADKVSPAIAQKLKTIANESKTAHSALQKLQERLNSLNASGLNVLTQALGVAQKATERSLLSAQRLATEQQRTATSAAQAAAAQTRAATAMTQGATATQNLATATTRAGTAQTQGATAAQKLATEQQRTAKETANAAAAADRAALAAIRLAQARAKETEATRKASASVLDYVKNTALAVGAGVGVAGILATADAYTVLQNKLQNVSTSQQQVNELTNRLFQIANETRTEVDATATAFARFDRALKGMGKSQEESLRLTETINKALVVGGASASEQASALLQLSQAFNSGMLQGEEFRAVAENMPMALDAVAKVLGKPISEIKKLGSEGKITAKVLFEAFKSIESSVDATFAKTLPTLGQSFTALKNSAIQTFGEFNKATGITAGLSKVILFLADNMKGVMVASAALGAALLVAFGAPLLAALAAASKAVLAFTLAIASNPVGLLIVGLTTAIAYIIAFGDKISLTSDKAVTLKDYFLTAFDYIKKAISTVSDFLGSAFSSVIEFITGKAASFSDVFVSIASKILTIFKDVTNFLIGLWVGSFQAIKTIWDKFPNVMEYVFASVVNFGASAVESLVNSWQIGLRTIATLGESIAPDMAKELNKALDATKIELPRMDIGDKAKTAANEVSKAFTDAFKKDYIGDANDAIMAKVRKDKFDEFRRSEKDSGLRGSGKDTTGNGSANAKAAEDRAKAMRKINAALDTELARMDMLKPAREVQQKFDQIEIDLASKKIKLTDAEASSIKNRLKAIQDGAAIQAEFDRIYEEAIGPQRTYNAALEASQKLYTMGAISQDQYTQSVIKSINAYQASIDPLFQINKELDEQSKLLKLLPKDREIEQQMMQIANEQLSKGIILSDEATNALRERLKAIQELNAISQQEASLMDASVGKREQYIAQLKAINNLKNDPKSGFTSGDASNAVMSNNSDLDFSNTSSMFEGEISKYEDMYSRINQLRAADLINEETAAALRTRVWIDSQQQQLNTASNFFGQLSQLQKSENSKMAAIGKAAAIAQAMISTYQSATSAYASLAPIPYVGPALGAAAAAAAIAAGMANVQQIRSQSTGFKDGGYTGNIGVNEVAGAVHGKEYVMDANTTSKIGVQNLDALRSGAAQVQRNGDNAGKAAPSSAPVAAAAPNVNVPVTAMVVQSKEAGMAAIKSSEGRAFILELIEENGSTIAKSIGVR